jgi:hypothetical protein
MLINENDFDAIAKFHRALNSLSNAACCKVKKTYYLIVIISFDCILKTIS